MLSTIRRSAEAGALRVILTKFYDYSKQRQWSLSRLEMHSELIRVRSDHAPVTAEFLRDPA